MLPKKEENKLAVTHSASVTTSQFTEAVVLAVASQLELLSQTHCLPAFEFSCDDVRASRDNNHNVYWFQFEYNKLETSAVYKRYDHVAPSITSYVRRITFWQPQILSQFAAEGYESIEIPVLGLLAVVG